LEREHTFELGQRAGRLVPGHEQDPGFHEGLDVVGINGEGPGETFLRL
jgi:hypothetical protein